MNQEIWQKNKIISWSQLLLDSYQKLLAKELITRTDNAQENAKALFLSPIVVVSHGKEANPIFNYGNQTALNLWEMSWQEFIQTPSKSPVNPDEIEQREELLKTVKNKGFVENYRGIRSSRTGKKFWIKNVTVWNIIDVNSNIVGQAATFPDWTFL
ncbi:MAG TPA: MEKHLA domain-containing protein [Cyanothece sp. UBA12306]|nr:MEKHLA domain-containing protein [Cyanothece sp. UBA12306]